MATLPSACEQTCVVGYACQDACVNKLCTAVWCGVDKLLQSVGYDCNYIECIVTVTLWGHGQGPEMCTFTRLGCKIILRDDCDLIVVVVLTSFLFKGYRDTLSGHAQKIPCVVLTFCLYLAQ